MSTYDSRNEVNAIQLYCRHVENIIIYDVAKFQITHVFNIWYNTFFNVMDLMLTCDLFSNMLCFSCITCLTGLVVSHNGENIMVRGFIPFQRVRVYHVHVPSAFQCSLWFRVVCPSTQVTCATRPLPLWGDHIAFGKIIMVH